MKNKVMLFSTLLLVFAVAGAASAAVTTTVGTFNSEAAAIQALDNWRGASDFALLETFEGFDPEVPVGGASRLYSHEWPVELCFIWRSPDPVSC